MQKTEIRIRGKVQGVGLRARIKAVADEIGVCGTVENLDDGSVLAVCEAERDRIKEMVCQVQDRAEPAVITDMPVEEASPATGMSGFHVVFGDTNTEMLTAILAGTEALRRMDKTLHRMDKTLHRMDKTQNEMRDTQNEMRDTQNEMNATTKSMDRKADLSLENDTEILKILKSMLDGGLLRIAK